VGDFLLQPAWIIERKRRASVLLLHVTIVTVAHLLMLGPFLSGAVVLAVLGVGAAHFVIDFVKIRRGKGGPGGLGLFVGDQAAHLATVLAAVALVSAVAEPAPHLSGEAVVWWATVAVVAGAFGFAWTGGDAIVQAALATASATLEAEDRGQGGAEDGVPGSGRLIGILERTIALGFIVLGQWAAIVLLVAVKSIARFEALKERRFAEYHLIGTLTSFLVAIVAGLVLAAALHAR
jgi:hypothetical protein